MYKHVIGHTYKTDAGSVSAVANTYSDNGESGCDVQVPANVTNYEVDWAVTKTEIQAICVSTDQDVTIKTNSTGTPQETIDLKAAAPIMVTPDMGTIPFASNVTKLYITNGNAKVANVKVRALLHLTV